MEVKMQKKVLLLGVLFLLVIPLIHSGILIKEKPNQQQVIVPRFMQTNVVYKIDKIYPIEKYNDTCFKTLIADKSKIANSISLSAEDITMLDKGKLPYYSKGIKLEIDYTKENIICHNLINGIYKWGFNSSQVEVLDVDTGVYNNTHSNTTAINVTLGVNGTYTSEVYAINGSRNTTNLTLNTKSLGDVLVEGSVRTSNNSYVFDFDYDDVLFTQSSGVVTNWGYTQDELRIWYGSCHEIQNRLLYIDGDCESSDKPHTFAFRLNDSWFEDIVVEENRNHTQLMMKVKVMQNSSGNFAASELNRIGIAMHLPDSTTLSDGWSFIRAGQTRGAALLEEAVAWRATNSHNNLTPNEWWWMKVIWNRTYVKGKTWKVGDEEGNTWNATVTNFGTTDLGKIYGGLYCMNVDCYFDDLMFCNMEDDDCVGWDTFSQFQSFSNGVDTKNYTMDRDANFVQWKVKMFSNTTDTTILYQDGTNITFWNQSLGGEAPPEFTSCQDGHTTNCTFPNSFSLDKEINLTCLCNISDVSWARNISFVGTGEINVSTTISFYNISPLTDGSIGWISTNGFMNQTH